MSNSSNASVPNPPPPEANPCGEPSASFCQKLLDSLHDAVYFVDRERRITYWNKGAEYLTGYAASEVIGRHCFDNFLMHMDEAGNLLCLGGCPLSKTIVDGQRREAEVYFRHKLGHRVPVSVRISPIFDDAGNILGAVEVFNDVTAKRNIERRIGELESLAFLDALTGAPNRRYIELKVKQAIQEVEQFDRRVGLLMVDVDHFKDVNDNHGHEVGDRTLKAVCNTLTHSLRSGDIVGRWGGEEFLVIAADVNATVLAAFAERCRMLIAESPIPINDEHVRVTVSVGATLIKPGDTDHLVINRADELMYKSKMSGRNQVTLG